MMLIAALNGMIPGVRYRFSQRTLLITATLVAVVLGAIVWSMRT
jgi:hypothetical protein